jgi:hypothetical protein
MAIPAANARNDSVAMTGTGVLGACALVDPPTMDIGIGMGSEALIAACQRGRAHYVQRQLHPAGAP